VSTSYLKRFIFVVFSASALPTFEEPQCGYSWVSNIRSSFFWDPGTRSRTLWIFRRQLLRTLALRALALSPQLAPSGSITHPRPLAPIFPNASSLLFCDNECNWVLYNIARFLPFARLVPPQVGRGREPAQHPFKQNSARSIPSAITPCVISRLSISPFLKFFNGAEFCSFQGARSSSSGQKK
jgi:hypothetical protein